MQQRQETARFVQGATMRHVVVMASTGAVGLVAVFMVDLINLFYLSLLGDEHIVAAIGFVGAVGFFQLSLAIGMTIGLGAIISRMIGSGAADAARRIAASTLTVILATTAVIGALMAIWRTDLLALLGARGESQAIAAHLLLIIAPAFPLASGGMACGALLRCVADARRALNVTLFAAIAAAAMDPLFIFGLHLGVTGAAISTVLSRSVLFAVGWWGATRAHDLIGRLEPWAIPGDLRIVFRVAGPAILTNLATPVGAAFVTHAMARFGAEAVAGQTSIDRLVPVAFGLIFALSGAVGPILAQNLGAARLDRVRRALRDSLLFVVVAVCGAWAVLYLAQDLIARGLGAQGEAAVLVHLFCTWLAGSFLFTGALFVANAAFNNLGFPLLSTLFNWGRATLGTIPLVMVGAAYGPVGVLSGQAAGSFAFGIAAAAVAFRVIGRLDRTAHDGRHEAPAVSAASATAAFAALTTRAQGHPGDGGAHAAT